jgi:hypothetical protein
MYPAVRAVKYYVRDRAWGARPNTCLSGEGWEMCYAPAPEPGEAPPAGAVWTKICVPSLQPNKEVKKDASGKETQIDHHCAWYRKKFTAANIQGERAILKCDQVLSEAWFYVNGKYVGHELHGAQPFEVDITDGFKPGQPQAPGAGQAQRTAGRPAGSGGLGHLHVHGHDRHRQASVAGSPPRRVSG